MELARTRLGPVIVMARSDPSFCRNMLELLNVMFSWCSDDKLDDIVTLMEVLRQLLFFGRCDATSNLVGNRGFLNSNEASNKCTRVDKCLRL